MDIKTSILNSMPLTLWAQEGEYFGGFQAKAVIQGNPQHPPLEFSARYIRRDGSEGPYGGG